MRLACDASGILRKVYLRIPKLISAGPAVCLGAAARGAVSSGLAREGTIYVLTADEGIAIWERGRSTLERCGDHVYPLVSKTVATASQAAIPGASPQETVGATTYTYDVNGNTVWTVIPPAGFDAMTASPSQLRDYGVPPEPSATEEPEAHSQWEGMLHKLKFAQPPNEMITIPDSASYLTTENWSGLLNTPESGVAYEEAVARYVQPIPESTPCSPNAAVFWAGIGGAWGGSRTLTQDGTAVNERGLGQNQGWWEILPENEVAVNFFATPDNGYTQAVVAYQLNDIWSMTLWNANTGELWSSGSKAGLLDGQTAEYVAERPHYENYEGRNGFPGLTKYGYMKWEEDLTNSRNPYEYPNESIEMVQGKKENLVSGHEGDILASTQEYKAVGSFVDVARGCN